MTDEEAEWLMPGITPELALGDPKTIHELFFPNAIAVLVTAGEKGAAYSFFLNDGMCSGKIEPFTVPVVETTGAGDAFSAGFIHALSKAMEEHPGFFFSCDEAKKEEVHEIVKFAAAVGALTCTNEGAIAAQPTYEQVQAFLNQQTEIVVEIVDEAEN
jgi:fructokinase